MAEHFGRDHSSWFHQFQKVIQALKRQEAQDLRDQYGFFSFLKCEMTCLSMLETVNLCNFYPVSFLSLNNEQSLVCEFCGASDAVQGPL